MRRTEFVRLNNGWDAEPNVPDPQIAIDGAQLALTFLLDSDPDTRGSAVGELKFSGCWRYRLGPTSDEGWYRKQCRFSLVAPEWGLFYEVRGDLGIQYAPDEWRLLGGSPTASSRHFLFLAGKFLPNSIAGTELFERPGLSVAQTCCRGSNMPLVAGLRITRYDSRGSDRQHS
jgi:hypothetical protein